MIVLGYLTSGNATEVTDGEGPRRVESQDSSVSVAHSDLIERIKFGAKEPGGASGSVRDCRTDSLLPLLQPTSSIPTVLETTPVPMVRLAPRALKAPMLATPR